MDGSAEFTTLQHAILDLEPKESGPPGQPHPRSLLIGAETLLGECGRILLELGHEIVAVVAPAGPAAQWARQAAVPVIDSTGDLHGVDLGSVDYLFSISNLEVLPSEILRIPRLAAINFHDGPLPQRPGINSPVWALLSGDSWHGVTWHLMNETIDGGAVLASETIVIEDGETALSLNTKCFEAGLRTFAAMVEDLDTALASRQPQQGQSERYSRRRDRPYGAATIDWAADASEIYALVSALTYGPYRNPLGLPKAVLNDHLFLIQQVRVTDSRSGKEPGTIVVDEGRAPRVATGTWDLELETVTDADGRPADLAGSNGEKFTPLSSDQAARLNALDRAAARYETWWRNRLSGRDCLQLSAFQPNDAVAKNLWRGDVHACSSRGNSRDLLAATVAYLGRVADRDCVEIGYSDEIHLARLENVRPWFASHLPLRVQIDGRAPICELQAALEHEISDLHRHVAVGRDLIARSPELSGRASLQSPITIDIVDCLDASHPEVGTILHIAIKADGSACRWSCDAARLDSKALDDLWSGFAGMMASLEDRPSTPLHKLSLLNAAELRRVTEEWNASACPVQSGIGIHRLFCEQASRTPDRVAVTSCGVSLTYAQLDARSNRLARYLNGLGVSRGCLVGLHVGRSVEMLVCLLAIHKAGGAYVPLDPAYPRDRIAHMISDSGMPLIVTETALAASLPPSSAALVCIDAIAGELDLIADDAFDGGAQGEDLAYMIYTSGSTGLPKGVMVEHRNVGNFFAGMDAHLEHGGVWLAVTSLSFDISVLELSWPLTCGYHVVIATEREVRGDVPADVSARPLDFSLFHFASSDCGDAREQYRLLLEGARFADDNGFAAIWTPERHFHDFGGPYPNPAVAAAALAATTSRIAIRAGSVVGTLHHPIRIAEEWALVDNLSDGRVGIAFASGWQPNDFVLNPPAFTDRAASLKQTIDDVRGLWRGEPRSYPGPLGHDVAITTYPRPIQRELPCWLTSAGNPETFAEAGRSGMFVLTHLLGQDVTELAEKIRAYRHAWRDAGYPGDGCVTLMLHTFVGDDAAAVREIARGPLTEYLRTSTKLLNNYAWSFPTFKRDAEGQNSGDVQFSHLSSEDMDALLDHAFNRYFDSNGLFGTPQDCLEWIDVLRGNGVDEIACLIDFGIPVQTVLDHLPALGRLRELAAGRTANTERSLPDLMKQYGVTHLQCTPSLLQVLATDDAARPQLAALKRLMVGGEAFPPHLARQAVELVQGAVMNMYGPTETTIWSAVHELDRNAFGPPPLGRPLANQQIYIVDRQLELVRPGSPGELIIGGKSVTRGYHDRTELTRDRFVEDPIMPGTRAYRSGDLARQREDGTIEFLGRLDHQIKIRGYRVELGEIEASIAGHPQVSEAVVTTAEDGGGIRLIAYVVAPPGGPSPVELREHLRASLPEFMVPAAFVFLGELPRTPNGKIDRKALPDPEASGHETRTNLPDEPVNELEAQIRTIWCEVLKVPSVGLSENFFDIGGHSLLAVQIHRRIATVSAKKLALTDIFRFPTIATLCAHLSSAGPSSTARGSGQRARVRREGLQRRRAHALAQG